MLRLTMIDGVDGKNLLLAPPLTLPLVTRAAALLAYSPTKVKNVHTLKDVHNLKNVHNLEKAILLLAKIGK